MRSKYAPNPSLKALPEWIEIRNILETHSENKGDWDELRSVRNKKEATWAVPLLLDCAQKDKYEKLQADILLALANRLTYPWTIRLLKWLRRETKSVTKMLIANCLLYVIDSETASSIWSEVRADANLPGGANLVNKLYQFENLQDEIKKWILELNNAGILNPSMRRVAMQIGVLEKPSLKKADVRAWFNRPRKTLEIPVSDDLPFLSSEVEELQEVSGIREMWSGEIGVEELMSRIEELERNYNVEILVGRDLLHLLKRRKEEGVLVQVSSLENADKTHMYLHIYLEDVDTATLRLMTLEWPGNC